MLLMIPASICLGLLFLHSLYFRPHRATLLFFLLGSFFAQLYGGSDFYIFNMKQIMIEMPLIGRHYPVPVLNVIGFLFTFYCSMSLAIHLLARNESRVSFFQLLTLTVFISAFIGIAIEYTNEAAKWWTWRFETNFLQLFGVWCWRSMLMFPLFYQFFIPPGPRRRSTVLWSLVWLFFFGAWMIYVDIFTFLRPFTIVLWALLPILAIKVKRLTVPNLQVSQLQFNHPVSPFHRHKMNLVSTDEQ